MVGYIRRSWDGIWEQDVAGFGRTCQDMPDYGRTCMGGHGRIMENIVECGRIY